MSRDNLNSNDAPDRLPEAVLARLEAAERPNVRPDADVDAAVLAAARAYFAGRAGSSSVRRGASSRVRRGARRRPARWAAYAAAASVVLAALLLVRPLGLFTTYDPDDIDRSGRVDILDAFALARMRAEGEPVAETRIDALAARVVALEPRSGAR
ncbi:MAG TPA: hypothetical protein VF339_02055 [Gammaproteobacteria bacterium]